MGFSLIFWTSEVEVIPVGKITSSKVHLNDKCIALATCLIGMQGKLSILCCTKLPNGFVSQTLWIFIEETLKLLFQKIAQQQKELL